MELPNTADTTNTNVADDFFSSLLSDLNKDIGGPMMVVDQKRSGKNPIPTKQTPSSSVFTSTPSSEYDFFSSLMSDLHTSPTTPFTSTSSSMGDSSVGVRSSQSNVRPVTKNQNIDDPTNRQDDDFLRISKRNSNHRYGSILLKVR